MDVFDVGVTLHLTDKISAALAQVSKQFTSTGTAAQALQNRLNKIHSLYKSGLVMAGGGAALAAPLVMATKSAMELESALARVKIQTGASDAQMQMLNKTFSETANKTAIFSKPTLAKFASEMYSGGITDVNQINRLLPIMAKAADVTQLMSGGKIQATDTLHTLTALSHQFGRYDTKGMTDIANAAVAMSLQLPGGMKSLLSTGSTINVPGNRMLGIDPIQLMAFQAAVAQTSGSTGAGGKGRMSAANQINALMRGLPGIFGAGLLSGKSAFAGAVLGLSDKYGASTVMKNGKMDFMAFQAKLAADENLSSFDLAKKMKTYLPMLGKKASDIQPLVDRAISTAGKGVDKKQLLAQIMTYMFGSASTVATLLGDPKFMAVQNKMTVKANDAIKQGGIDEMQRKISETLEFQLHRVQTSFGTLSSTIGTQLIPVLTPIVTKVGDIVDQVNTFAEANPRVVQLVAGLTAAASGALLLGGAINIARAGFMGLRLVFPLLTKSLGPLGLAITAAVLVADHWSDVMKTVHDNSRFVVNIMAQLGHALDAIGEIASKLVGVFFRLGRQLAGTISAIPGMKDLGASIGKAIDDAMKVDDITNKQNEKYLREKGWGGALDYVKGGVVPGKVDAQGEKNFLITALKGQQQKQPVVNVTNHNNVTVNAPPGTNPAQVADMIDKRLSNLGKNMAQAALASGGPNSVANSGNTRGNYRN